MTDVVRCRKCGNTICTVTNGLLFSTKHGKSFSVQMSETLVVTIGCEKCKQMNDIKLKGGRIEIDGKRSTKEDRTLGGYC